MFRYVRLSWVGHAHGLAPCGPGDVSMQSRNGRPSPPADTAGGGTVRAQPPDGELASENPPRPPGAAPAPAPPPRAPAGPPPPPSGPRGPPPGPRPAPAGPARAARPAPADTG